MRLWDKKYLSITFFTSYPQIWTERYEFRVSKNVYDLISERLTNLELKPYTKKLKNKLKTKQYIQFGIVPIPFPINKKEIFVHEPKFKSNSDTVVIDLLLPFIEYNDNNYEVIFFRNLKIAIKEGLSKLNISIAYIDDIFFEIYKEIIGNNQVNLIDTL